MWARLGTTHMSACDAGQGLERPKIAGRGWAERLSGLSERKAAAVKSSGR